MLATRRAQVLLEVEDSGIGIPVKYQANIFQRYSPLTKRRTADGFTGDSTGTGLGMSICKELVELMGGRIWLKSTPHVQAPCA